MNQLLAFLKQKNSEFEKSNNTELNIEIENFSKKNNVSMAKSAQSLNVLQTLKVSDHLNDFTKLVKNSLKENGYQFEDSSIVLMSEEGRLTGLSIEESRLWTEGIYFKSKIEVSVFEELNIQTPKQEKAPERLRLSL